MHNVKRCNVHDRRAMPRGRAPPRRRVHTLAHNRRRWWLPALQRDGQYPVFIAAMMEHVRKWELRNVQRVNAYVHPDTHGWSCHVSCEHTIHVEAEHLNVVKGAGDRIPHRPWVLNCGFSDSCACPRRRIHRGNALCNVRSGGKYIDLLLDHRAEGKPVRFSAPARIPASALLDHADWKGTISRYGYYSWNEVFRALWAHGRLCFATRAALDGSGGPELLIRDLVLIVVSYLCVCVCV